MAVSSSSPSLSTRTPSVAPVSSPSLSFSISRILGLDDKPPMQSQCCTRPLSPTTCDRKPSNYGDFIFSSLERSSPYFQDRATGSEEDWRSEQPEKKKRQRTTFSPIEVWEFERAFQRRPYLTPADEEELVQRLGIPAKSVKYWFQNRRAKSRKRERKLITDLQSNLSNLTGKSNLTVHPIYGVHSERQYPSNLFRLPTRVCCPATSSGLEGTLSLPQPVSIRRHHLSFRPNQLVRSSFPESDFMMYK